MKGITVLMTALVSGLLSVSASALVLAIDNNSRVNFGQGSMTLPVIVELYQGDNGCAFEASAGATGQIIPCDTGDQFIDLNKNFTIKVSDPKNCYAPYEDTISATSNLVKLKIEPIQVKHINANFTGSCGNQSNAGAVPSSALQVIIESI